MPQPIRARLLLTRLRIVHNWKIILNDRGRDIQLLIEALIHNIYLILRKNLLLQPILVLLPLLLYIKHPLIWPRRLQAHSRRLIFNIRRPGTQHLVLLLRCLIIEIVQGIREADRPELKLIGVLEQLLIIRLRIMIRVGLIILAHKRHLVHTRLHLVPPVIIYHRRGAASVLRRKLLQLKLLLSGVNLACVGAGAGTCASSRIGLGISHHLGCLHLRLVDPIVHLRHILFLNY